jgi:hypothetical protein
MTFGPLGECFPDDIRPGNRLLGKGAIRFKDQLHSFLKIFPDFFQSISLGVRAWQFLYKPGEPLRRLNKNGRQF